MPEMRRWRYDERHRVHGPIARTACRQLMTVCANKYPARFVSRSESWTDACDRTKVMERYQADVRWRVDALYAVAYFDVVGTCNGWTGDVDRRSFARVWWSRCKEAGSRISKISRKGGHGQRNQGLEADSSPAVFKTRVVDRIITAWWSYAKLSIINVPLLRCTE